jgi:predicted small lipoprotein YifL
VLAALLLLSAAAACGSSGGEMNPPAAAEQNADGAEDPDYPYQVYTRGMFADTLSGTARFGNVFDPVTRRRQWIVSMRSGGDVTSGVYLARPDTTLPDPGTYQIVKRKPVGRYDSLRAADKNSFTMIYRAGMRRSFHSQSGTVELTTVTDTLVEGTIDATLGGSAALPGQPPQEGALTVRGDFRATKATVGFMFGV